MYNIQCVIILNVRSVDGGTRLCLDDASGVSSKERGGFWPKCRAVNQCLAEGVWLCSSCRGLYVQARAMA